MGIELERVDLDSIRSNVNNLTMGVSYDVFDNFIVLILSTIKVKRLRD